MERRAAWEAAKAANPQREFVGTCLDMCPEFERHEREAHFDLSQFEIVLARESRGCLMSCPLAEQGRLSTGTWYGGSH